MFVKNFTDVIIKNSMIYLNEQIKKYLKIAGIVAIVMFLYGVFNLFSGKNITNKKSISLTEMPMTGGMSNEMSGYNEVSDDKLKNRNFASKSSGMNNRALDISNTQSLDKKIIKNGNLNLKVEKINDATREIREIVQSLNGEIFSTNFSERIKGQRRGSLTVKVPVAKFSEAISEIKKVSTQVVNETTTGRDVTEQYADLQVQLKNKQAEEESFVKILDRAGKIDDVLAVTKQIARVRGEIERLQGQIKYMNSQTEMSTITVSLSEDIGVTSVNDNWRPWQTIKKSFQELINNIQDFTDSIIRFLIVGIPSLIPFLIFLAIVYWGGRRIYRMIIK